MAIRIKRRGGRRPGGTFELVHASGESALAHFYQPSNRELLELEACTIEVRAATITQTYSVCDMLELEQRRRILLDEGDEVGAAKVEAKRREKLGAMLRAGVTADDLARLAAWAAPLIYQLDGLVDVDTDEPIAWPELPIEAQIDALLAWDAMALVALTGGIKVSADLPAAIKKA